MALSGLEVANFAYAAGFRGQALIYAIAIAKRESGWRPEAHNPDASTGDDSMGLMQINMLGNLGPDRMRTLQGMGYDVNTVEEAKRLLLDPAVNMRFAYHLSGGGSNFGPWTTAKGIEAGTDLQDAAQYASQATGETIAYVPGAPNTGGGGVDEELEGYKQREREAYEAWKAAAAAQGITGTDEARRLPEFRAWQAAAVDREFYETSFGSGTSSSSVDPAQQAFENQITLGDFQLGEGKLAYDRWADKYDRAQTAANEQIDAVHTRNEENAKLRQNALASSERRLQPYAEGKSYVPATYDDAFARWKKEMGVGEEPALYGTGGPSVPSPSAPSSGGGGGGGGGSAPTKKKVVAQIGPEQYGPFQDQNEDSPTSDWRDYPVVGPLSTNQLNAFGGEIRGAAADFGRDWLQEAQGTTRRGWRRAKQFGSSRLSPEVLKNTPGGRLAGKIWPFADGVQNFQGGTALVGEEGEEIVELPGVGRVKASGPTLMNLPKGANVIPRETVMAQQKIGQLAQGGADPGQKLREAQMRREDPALEQKVLEALYRALGAQLGVKPGATPVLEPGQSDLWAHKRPLTGVQAFPPPMEVK